MTFNEHFNIARGNGKSKFSIDQTFRAFGYDINFPGNPEVRVDFDNLNGDHVRMDLDFRGRFSYATFINYLYYCGRDYTDGLPLISPDRIDINKVIFNDPATIVLWGDNTKTVVKCQKGDIYDPEKGLYACIVKKVLGNKSNFNNVINKWVTEYKEEK